MHTRNGVVAQMALLFVVSGIGRAAEQRPSVAAAGLEARPLRGALVRMSDGRLLDCGALGKRAHSRPGGVSRRTRGGLGRRIGARSLSHLQRGTAEPVMFRSSTGLALCTYSDSITSVPDRLDSTTGRMPRVSSTT